MSQSLTNLLVHIIFSTANREPFLRDAPLRSEMHRFLGGVVKHHDGNAISVGGVADHVHLLCVVPKTMSVSDLVRELKRGSSLRVKERDLKLRSFAWQGGYGAFSVGQTEVDIVRAYIEGQEEHHKTRTFQEEYRGFLNKYGIQYDERYVWE
jgi:REP element-mobilizing transposase RayT